MQFTPRNISLQNENLQKASLQQGCVKVSGDGNVGALYVVAGRVEERKM